jgi:lipopolysaccharide transport system permease protein
MTQERNTTNTPFLRRWNDLAHDLMEQRHLLWGFVLKDFKSRYAGSLGGQVWNIIHPIIMVTIYTIIFGKLLGAKLSGQSDSMSYGIYLCAGLIPWISFQEVVLRQTTVFTDNRTFLKRLNVPRNVILLQVLVGSLINFAFLFGVFLVLFSFVKWSHLYLVPLFLSIVLFQQLAAFGLGTMGAVIHLFYRDTVQILQVIFQFWFWLTPIVYVEEILPNAIQPLLRLNPMYHFMDSYHRLLSTGALPQTGSIVLILCFTGLMLLGGIYLINKVSAELVDHI